MALTACPFRYSSIGRTSGQEKRDSKKDQEKTKEQGKTILKSFPGTGGITPEACPQMPKKTERPLPAFTRASR
jgi:hypothetical protein